MNSFLFPVTSKATVNFLEALITGAATPMNNLPGPRSGSYRFLIRAIAVDAMEQFGPEFWFFSRAAGVTADPDTDDFLSKWQFTDGMAAQIGSAGLWRYYADGLAIPYVDLDALNTINPMNLHVILQNGSATPKSANAAGAIATTFWLEPQVAY